jgi:hypothetical protein
MKSTGKGEILCEGRRRKLNLADLPQLEGDLDDFTRYYSLTSDAPNVHTSTDTDQPPSLGDIDLPTVKQRLEDNYST